MAPSFDAYVMVDWSAASVPTTGKDSIWVACVRRRGAKLRRTVLENIATRAAATARISDLLTKLLQDGARVLAGFDFPFGYPRGTANALGLGHDGLLWRKTWAAIDALIEDAPDNRNNRFDAAEVLNQKLTGEPFPFWGHAGGGRPYLLRRGRRPHGATDLPERRYCELRVRRTQPVWKLAYTGSVGSQVLTGLPRIWQIRTDPRLAFQTLIWPFETGLADRADARCILAEIYPSLVQPLDLEGKPKDAGQVAAMSRRLGELDLKERLPVLFAGDPALSTRDKDTVVREEAWILGVTDQPMVAI